MSGPVADNLPLPPLPAEKFAVAAIDLPLHFQTRGRTTDPKADRSPKKHYPTMDLAACKAIPMQDILLPDAWVFCWMWGPAMVKGYHLALAKAWGLELSAMAFVWIKLWNGTDMTQYQRTPLLEQDLALGGGYTTRANAEYVILMKRGNPRVARRDIRQVIVSPRREHSRKPEEFYRRVEHFAVGPRIDMFGGARRAGWTHFGQFHRPEDDMPYFGEATA